MDDENSIKTVRYIPGGLYGKNGGGVSSSVYGQRTTYKKHITENNEQYQLHSPEEEKLKRPYGITVHKSQGSTYPVVIIPVYDYYSLSHFDTNQLLYVAMSRAKDKIIFVDKNEQFDQTSKRHSFTEYEKQAICSTYDYKCAKCSSNLIDRDFDIDHIVPIANGGKNSVENLQPLCKICHKRKTANEKY